MSNKNFKFSIIIAIYNTEEFLEEAIESIINQTIGFEDIELILVDDGSIDSSKDICLRYKEKYPDNIQYYYQENQGQATARNNGMKLARGKYINFLDSDDKLELNTLSNVYNFFKTYHDETDVVSIPIKFFDRETGDHILNYKYESTRLVDLIKEPSYIQLSASSAFFKKDAIKDNIFDTELVVSEDAIFLNKILLEKCTMGVISDSNYLYRKRNVKGSTIDSSIQKKDYYIHRSKTFFKGLFDYCKQKHGELLDFIKYTIMYDIQWMFHLRDVSDVLNEDEMNELYSILHELLQEIDDEIILDQKHPDKTLLTTILIFKHGGLTTVKDDNRPNVIKKVNDRIIDQLYYHVFYLDAVEIHENNLYVLGFLKSFFKPEEIKIEAVKYSDEEFTKYWTDYFNKNKIIFLKDEFLNVEGKTVKNNYLSNAKNHQNEYYESDLNSYTTITDDLNKYYEFNELNVLKKYIDGNTYAEKQKALFDKFLNEACEIHESKYVYYAHRDRTYLNKVYNPAYNFEFCIPLNPEKSQKFKIRVTYENLSFYLDLNFNFYSRLTKESFYSKKEEFIVRFIDNTLIIQPYTITSLLKLEKENIKYLSSKFDMDELNEVVKFRQHYYYSYFKFKNRRIWLFLDRPDMADDNAEHLYKYAIKQNDGIEKYFILSEESKDFDRLKPLGNIVKYGSDEHKLLACFAEKIISSHPDNEIVNPFSGPNEKFYNGLFSAKICWLQHGITLNNVTSWLRKYDKFLYLLVTAAKQEHQSFFDNPYNYSDSVVQLLGFPRFDNLHKGEENNQIIIMPTWRRFLRVMNDEQIKNSEYFQRLNSLLNSEDLIEFAQKNDFKIIFKPHPNLIEYLHLFDRNDYVKFDCKSSYQDIFKKSKIFITDYSSAIFDVAYMKKPIIYYQYENDGFHFDLNESYFDFNTMGFGDIVDNEKEVIECVKNIVKNDCEMYDKYKARVDNFYEFTDDNNCKRVYNFILDI